MKKQKKKKKKKKKEKEKGASRVSELHLQPAGVAGLEDPKFQGAARLVSVVGQSRCPDGRFVSLLVLEPRMYVRRRRLSRWTNLVSERWVDNLQKYHQCLVFLSVFPICSPSPNKLDVVNNEGQASIRWFSANSSRGVFKGSCQSSMLTLNIHVIVVNQWVYLILSICIRFLSYIILFFETGFIFFIL